MKRALVGMTVVALMLGVAGCGGAAPAPKEAGKQAAPAEQKTDFPTKPINFVVPYEAGAGVDIEARWIADKAAAKLAQPVVIINKPGAAGTIGGADIHDAKPDGYTIGGPSTLATNYLQGLVPYDHRGFDLIGIWRIAAPTISTSSQRPWKTLKEVVDYAKANPGKLTIATVSKGGAYWIQTLLFARAAGIQLEILPQPGGAAYGITQLAGGHVDLAVADIPASKAQYEAGNIRILANLDAVRPSGKYKDIPSAKELGYDFNYYAGSGIRVVVGPKGMPKPVYDRLVKAFGDVCTSDEYKAFLEQDGSVPVWISGEDGMKVHDEQAVAVRPALEEAGLLKVK